MLSLVKKLLYEPPVKSQSCQLVFKGELASEVADPWMKRIIALADGRPVGEIAQALYLQELRAGAETTDIGLWRGLFLHQVSQTLKEMSDRGYIQLIDMPDTSPYKSGSR